MAESFTCPSCGAPLSFKTGSFTINCPYCRTSVIVPNELRSTSPAAAGRSAAPVRVVPPPPIPKLPRNQAALISRISELVHSGQKIAAVTVFRQATGLGLKQAKDAVDAIEAGRPENINFGTLPAGGSMAPEKTALYARIAALARAGRRDEAADLLRANSDFNQFEAYEVVDRLAFSRE